MIFALLLACGAAPADSTASLPSAAAAPATAPRDFWAHWGDGKAELSGYALTQPRYGEPRDGTAVLIFVTEDFSWSERVKADPGQHPDADIRKVLKVNANRDFQTGIYPYHVMTSVFARVDAGDGMPAFSPIKTAFSAQEWCGMVYTEATMGPGDLRRVEHTYFDGDTRPPATIAVPGDVVYGDALPLVVRGFGGPAVEPGGEATVPWWPSTLSVRFAHEEPKLGEARIARAAATETLVVPAGTFTVERWTVSPKGEPATTWWVEAAPPRRVVAWAGEDGERAELRGSARLPYWKLNNPGDEPWREKIGLPAKAP